jgi:short-subunit dehydrogenase
MEAAKRVALITGATRGIGLAFAQEYALAHHRKDLILIGRSESALRALAKELRKNQGGRIEIIVADLTAPDSGEGVAEQLLRLGMKVDVLVNAASATHVGDFAEQPPQNAQAQITLQCAAMVDLCQVLAPAMIAQRFGTIINVAAAAGWQPRPYAASPAASPPSYCRSRRRCAPSCGRSVCASSRYARRRRSGWA